MNRPFSHCTRCGVGLPDGSWPRTCGGCGHAHYLNPLPVAVLLQPVGDGLLTVRRTIEPRRGQLAFPGGFIELEESWQQAAARELREETQIAADPDTVRLFDVLSAPDGTVLIFGIAPPISADLLIGFEATEEVDELAIVGEEAELAFPLHTRILERWLDENRRGK